MNLLRRIFRKSKGSWLIAGLIFVVVIMLGTLGNDVRREVDNLNRTSSENAQWTLSQSDTDFLSMIVSLLRLRAGDVTPDMVRQRFDIFYSRAEQLLNSPLYSDFTDIPEYSDGMAQVTAYLQRYLPVIDGPDAGVEAAVSAMLNDAVELRPYLRAMTMRSLHERVVRGETQRENLRLTGLRMVVVMALLLTALFVAVFLLNRALGRMTRQSAKLHQAHSRVQAVISSSPDAILVLNCEGSILDANAAAAAQFGFDLEALKLMNVRRLIALPPGEAAGTDAQLLPAPGAQQVRLTGRRKDGETFPAECSVTATETETSRLRIVFMRDISDRLAGEQRLVEARDHALAGEKAKAEMLAVMSHEIRTPLNGILGTLDLISTIPDPQDHQTHLSVIRKSARLLLGHVNDVLEISRLDAQEMTPGTEVINLPALLRDMVDSQQALAQQAGNRLELSGPPPELHWVYGDEVRLRRVLLNLLGNAVKFTRGGQVRLSVYGNGAGAVIFEVSDTGIGIAAEDLNRIFEEFVTLDASYSRTAQGTGLGLAISRRLVEQMGGALVADSKLGEGSLFRVILPMEAATPEAEDPVPEAATPLLPTMALSVLVVEDNPINRYVVRSMLQEDGHSVTEAASGPEALPLAEKQRYDLILMDIAMPGLDGIATTRLIRERSLVNNKTPVVALTAHAHPTDHNRIREGGIPRVLTKPLRRAGLRQLLHDVATELSAERTSLLPPGDPLADVQDQSVFDPGPVRELLSVLGRDSFGSLRDKFVAETGGDIARLRPSAELPDLAHRTAGAAALFGAVALHKTLQQVEILAREGDNSALEAQLARLPGLWEISRRELEAI